MSSTTIAPQPIAKYEPRAISGNMGTLRSLVTGEGFLAAMREIAPRHLKPEKLVRMAIAAASRQPRLLQCTQESILKSVIEAGILGLDCSGSLGRGYLVPYKNKYLSQKAGHDVYEAQFQAGYLGLCDLARRADSVQAIYAKAVFQGDEFEYEEGIEPKLVHKPNLSADAIRTKEKLRLVYAVCVYKDGFRQPHVMTVAEVETHRQRSRAKDNGPWVTDYMQMCLKTVTRQLCKWVPQTPELEQVMIADDVEWRDPDTSGGFLDHVVQADDKPQTIEDWKAQQGAIEEKPASTDENLALTEDAGTLGDDFLACLQSFKADLDKCKSLTAIDEFCEKYEWPPMSEEEDHASRRVIRNRKEVLRASRGQKSNRKDK